MSASITRLTLTRTIMSVLDSTGLFDALNGDADYRWSNDDAANDAALSMRAAVLNAKRRANGSRVVDLNDEQAHVLYKIIDYARGAAADDLSDPYARGEYVACGAFLRQLDRVNPAIGQRVRSQWRAFVSAMTS